MILSTSPSPALSLERDLLAQPETRVLLAAARPTPDPRLEAEVEQAHREGLDWNVLLRLARAHRLVPHAARSLSTLQAVPAPTRETLQAAALRNAHRQLQLAEALDRVLAALSDAGVPSLPLKGPPLSVWLFGDPARRMSRDLDLLVPRAALADAVEAVRRAGFDATSGGARLLSAAEASVVAREFVLNEASFFDARRRIALELHWRPYRLPRLLRMTAALNSALRVQPSGRTAWDVGPEAAVTAYVLAHGAAHGYRRLGWLVDAARLADRVAAPVWDDALALAEADGAGAFVLLGPFLAERLLGAVFPPAVHERLLRHERRLTRLAQRCGTREPGVDEMNRAFFQLTTGLYDRPSDRLRYVWEYLTAPAEGELPDADLRPTALARLRRRTSRPRRLAGRAVRR